jgi:hypothetical protein
MDSELEEVKQWKKIRVKLDQTYKFDKTWEEAILLFETRLMRKFFNPIQTLIDKKVLEGEGFSIVTVQCSLIEAFAAFRQGKIHNHDKTSSSPSYEYNKSKQMFTSLLRSASIFQDNFWKTVTKNGKTKTVTDQPFNANDFYTNVRCGLMHEARTKGNWYITATPLTKSVRTETKFIVSEGGKTKILRTILHYRLLNYLKNYQDELREQTPKGNELRKFFARKLDHLFDINADTSYDWWN